MRYKTLCECGALAEKFVRLAKDTSFKPVGPPQANHCEMGSRAAAIERASMDLTRALVRLRGGK